MRTLSASLLHRRKERLAAHYSTLLIGGSGTIGSGLRTYHRALTRVITSSPRPTRARDKANEDDAQRAFVELDLCEDPEAFGALLADYDLVVYLARKNPLQEMNAMTDLVFEAVLGQETPPMMVASSSVHAVDGLYSFNDEDSVYWPMADRNFDAVNPWPERISAKTPAHAPNDYAREKEYAEQWCQKMADKATAPSRRAGVASTSTTPSSR